MDRKKIEKVIKSYLKDLSKKIKIERTILFGSAISGKFNKNSDIDLLVLSSSFAKMDINDRFDLLNSARQNKETQITPMDIFGLTPHEYNNANPLSIIAEIKETGIEI